MSDKPIISRREAINKLWELGNLQWKLDDNQKSLYSNFLNVNEKVLVWMCSRQIGKSTTLCIIAVETCLKNPNVIVKYAAPQQNMVRKFIRPILRDLFAECPSKLKPKFFTQDNVWRFPNGSEIQISGTDNGRAESLRGGKSHLCIVDEAGFCDDLDYLVNSILIPTTTTTGGKVILSSTPPVSPDHSFISKYKEQADAKGILITRTIEDNPRLSKEEIEDLLRSMGGRDHPDVRREYFCEVIKKKDRSIVPEWTAELEQEIVQDWQKPPFYDCYVAMDIGFKDLTVALFAYYDFKMGKIVIEDEVVMNGREMTTDALAKNVKEAEKVNWYDTNTGQVRHPYIRVADNNLIVLNDLYRLHDLLFIPTAKDDSDAALNQMRMKLAAKSIIIHPRCKTLLRHLRNGVWNKSRTGFERTEVDGSHFDAIDALKYMVRNINYSRNPYPENYDQLKGEYFEAGWYNEAELPPLAKHLKSIFSVPTSLKRNKPH